MNLTITLDEPTAAWLRERASRRNLPPEEAVRDLLGEARRKDAGDEEWGHANRRRVELIYKDMEGKLLEEEKAELARLQAEADARLAPMDERLIAAAERFRKLAEGLPHGIKP